MEKREILLLCLVFVFGLYVCSIITIVINLCVHGVITAGQVIWFLLSKYGRELLIEATKEDVG